MYMIAQQFLLFGGAWSMDVHRSFSREGNVNILLVLVRLLTMQYKRTFTKRLTFSTRLHHRENARCYQ